MNNNPNQNLIDIEIKKKYESTNGNVVKYFVMPLFWVHELFKVQSNIH